MKKILAIFFLLMLAAFFSVQPRVQSHSSASDPAAKVVIPDAPSGVEPAESKGSLAVRPQSECCECPPGYFNCDGCCVPYACAELENSGS